MYSALYRFCMLIFDRYVGPSVLVDPFKLSANMLSALALIYITKVVFFSAKSV